MCKIVCWSWPILQLSNSQVELMMEKKLISDEKSISFHMMSRSWGLLLVQEDGPGLYILTRTRQKIHWTCCCFAAAVLRLGDLKVANSSAQRCPDVFFSAGQPLYRQVLRMWIQMMMNWLMSWMKAGIYRLDNVLFRRYTEDAYVFFVIVHIWYLFTVCVSH